jgi:hypothetical protein
MAVHLAPTGTVSTLAAPPPKAASGLTRFPRPVRLAGNEIVRSEAITLKRDNLAGALSSVQAGSGRGTHAMVPHP